MISYINGILEQVEPNRIVVDVNGIGYDINVPVSIVSKLPKTGEKVKIHTYMHVREDAMLLFGFPTKEEKNLFVYLISVSGIGPKVAMSLLSAFPSNQLVIAITRGDIDYLSSAPGIGKKTAQRMVIELKEKIGKAYSMEVGDENMSLTAEDPVIKDAVSALIALGYQPREARQAVFKSGVDLRAKPAIEEVIKQSLRVLS